jgi:hypothetical protein
MIRNSLIVISALFLFSCNPVRRILKDKDKTAQVVAEYVKQNPPKNDTTIHVGIPMVRDSIVRDTIQLPVPIKERYETIHYRDNVRVDTVKVIDRSLLQALDTRVQNLETQLKVITEERDYYRGQYRLYLSIVIGIAVIGLIIIGVKVYSFFTLKKLI